MLPTATGYPRSHLYRGTRDAIEFKKMRYVAVAKHHVNFIRALVPNWPETGRGQRRWARRHPIRTGRSWISA